MTYTNAPCGRDMRYAVCGMRYAATNGYSGNQQKGFHNVQMRLWFVVRIRTRQTESVVVAIQNVSAHISDRKFQEVTSLQTCFPIFHKWRTVLAGRQQHSTFVVKYHRNCQHFRQPADMCMNCAIYDTSMTFGSNVDHINTNLSGYRDI